MIGVENIQSVRPEVSYHPPVIGHYFCSYFSSISDPISLHIPYPTFLLYAYLGYVHPLMPFMPYTLTNKRQEHNSIGTTGHQTIHLLGYRHSETVLLWFLLTRILRRNLLCRHRTLPPLKVPDFPDTEHEQECVHRTKTSGHRKVPRYYRSKIALTDCLHAMNRVL